MIVIVVHIAQQHRRVIHAIDHHVDLAVVEEISEGCAACRDDVGQTRSFHGRDDFELPAVVDVMKQQRPLRP